MAVRRRARSRRFPRLRRREPMECACTFRRPPSHRDLCLDVRVWVIAFEGKILEAECEYIRHGPVDPHLRQPPRRPPKLEPGVIEMVKVQVGVAEGVNKVPGSKAGDVRYHHG